MIAAAPIQKLTTPATEVSTGNISRTPHDATQSFSDVMATATTPKPVAKEEEGGNHSRRQSPDSEEKKQAAPSHATPDAQIALLQSVPQVQATLSVPPSLPPVTTTVTPDQNQFAIPGQAGEQNQNNTLTGLDSSPAIVTSQKEVPQFDGVLAKQQVANSTGTNPKNAPAPANVSVQGAVQDAAAANSAPSLPVPDASSKAQPATDQPSTDQAASTEAVSSVLRQIVAQLDTERAKVSPADAKTPAQSSTDGTAAPEKAQVSADQTSDASQTTAAPNPSDGTAALLQMRNELVANRAGQSPKIQSSSRSATPAESIKAVQPADDAKVHAQRPADHSSGKADSDGSSQSDDQGQPNTMADVQPVVQSKPDASSSMPAVNGNVHAPIAHVESTPRDTQTAAASAHATARQENVAAATAAPVHEQPLVNTARLIQSVNEAGLRVGMRTAEFGNVSISTSANRDVLSAQISVEHGELAKAISAHLPEVQNRIGATQAIEVRVGTNAHSDSQAGTMSQDSSGQRGGQGESRQATTSVRSVVQGFEQARVPDVVVAAAESVRSDSRLSIRV